MCSCRGKSSSDWRASCPLQTTLLHAQLLCLSETILILEDYLCTLGRVFGGKAVQLAAGTRRRGKGTAATPGMRRLLSAQGAVATTFADKRLEAVFSTYCSAHGRPCATIVGVVACVLWSTALLRVVVAALVELSLTPRRALLMAVLTTGDIAQVRSVQILSKVEQAWRHENAKTWQVLVSLTACMVASILARQDELNMKHPVVVSAVRAWFFLGERYRLPVLLRLHAICLVCYAMQEADLAMLTSKHRDAGTLVRNSISLLACQAVPFVIGVAWEARIRRNFLVSHGLALAQIGPFWRNVLQLTGGQLTPARSRSR